MPYNEPNEPFIYVLYDHDGCSGPLIYVPTETDKFAGIDILIPKHQVDLILPSVPVLVLGGTIGGGILSGPLVPAIVAGGLVAGWAIQVGAPLLKEWKAKKEAKAKEKLEKSKGGGGGGDDDDDDEDDKDKDKKKDKEEKPARIYEPNPKHHQNSKDGIGKEPKDPHNLLQQSKKGPDEHQRVAVQDDKYVIFREHSPGKYHGYIVEKWTDILPKQRTAFYRGGLVKSPKSGKIK